MLMPMLVVSYYTPTIWNDETTSTSEAFFMWRKETLERCLLLEDDDALRGGSNMSNLIGPSIRGNGSGLRVGSRGEGGH